MVKCGRISGTQKSFAYGHLRHTCTLFSQASTAPDDAVKEGSKTRVFQGGSVIDLHKMLGVSSGSQVLYVGDHIYSDLLRSRKVRLHALVMVQRSACVHAVCRVATGGPCW